ncbi:unnamed protein product [Allacma fusca]|uniref:Uncharacterized protein n=1 Tax=Allacma fusca TaxID=39272 RepID=A0A8J2P9I2_9HEXA|nr:unnamed protein product [Allacma fusca]
MKYGLGIRMLIAFTVGAIGVLYKLRVDPTSNKSEISSVITVPRQFLFDVIADPNNVPAYFSWVTRLRSLDKRNVVVGKRYRGILNMPFFGQHQITYKVTDCQEGTWLVLRPEKKEQSYFNTEVLIMLNSISKSQTQFYMKIIYHRKSALFQLTLAPVLKWLTDQQLRRTALNVRALAMSKWKRLKGGHVVPEKGSRPNQNQTKDAAYYEGQDAKQGRESLKRSSYVRRYGGKLEL